MTMTIPFTCTICKHFLSLLQVLNTFATWTKVKSKHMLPENKLRHKDVFYLPY